MKIRLLTRHTVQLLLRTAAHARHEARRARRDLARGHATERALVAHLARRDDVRLLLVPVPTAEAAPQPEATALAVLLLALWGQATAERDAFRQWVTEDPDPIALEQQMLLARAAQAAGAAAAKDTP